MDRTCHISDLMPGDSVAFGPVDIVGTAVSLGTYPPWPFYHRMCHFAVVAGYNGVSSIYESTVDPGLGPCIHADVNVAGVQVHGLVDRMKIHGERGGLAWRLPLLPYNLWGIQSAQYQDVENVCRLSLGVGYDFRGAWAARFAIGGWTKWYRGRDPDAAKLLFCSEYALYCHQQLGLVSHKLPIEKYHPKATARFLENEGICGPPEEIVL